MKLRDVFPQRECVVVVVENIKYLFFCIKLNAFHSFDFLTVDSLSSSPSARSASSSSDVLTITIVTVGRFGTLVEPHALVPVVRDPGHSSSRDTATATSGSFVARTGRRGSAAAAGATSGRRRRTARPDLPIYPTAPTPTEHTAAGYALQPGNHATTDTATSPDSTTPLTPTTTHTVLVLQHMSLLR